MAWRLGYEKTKQKAKRLYSKIGRIQSPALNNEYVAFTSDGFNHLVRKGRIPRSKSEQKKRFILLPHAEKIITNPKAVMVYRTNKASYYVNRHGEKILTTSTAQFWTFIEKGNNFTIKVVVRQLNNGQKHFFSIMGNRMSAKKNIKRPPKTKKSP